jgi:hypothetical protein
MKLKKILTIIFSIIGCVFVAILLAKVLDDYPSIILIIALIICAALVLILIVATFTKNPTSQEDTVNTPNTTKKERGVGYYAGRFLLFVFGIIVLYVLVLAGIWLYNFVSEYLHKDLPPNETFTDSNSLGQKETTYLFSDYPDRKITQYLDLTHGAHWEVLGEKGQKIFIQIPNGNIWEDESGINYARPITENGNFTFWEDPKNPGARGIKIKI